VNPQDQLPLLAVLLVCIVLQIAFIELGFRYGMSRRGSGYKAQMAQVRAIMGASLGLLAFMLAFSFNIAQQHFEERSSAYMMEVSAIHSTLRSAALLDERAESEARNLLGQFTRLRIATTEATRSSDLERVVVLIRESEQIHGSLWALADALIEDDGEGENAVMFAQSVLAMIAAHDARLQATLFNRISPVIWATLVLMAALSMVVTGYQAGLTGTRSGLATWTLAITFAAVLTLITDLDRPRMTLFEVNQQLMFELEARLSEGVTQEPGIRSRR
jgi:hypothetical protein